MQHHALFRPPAVQRLVRLEPLVAVQRFALVGFDQRGVHVQGRHRHPPVRLEEPEQRLVDLPQAADWFGQRRDERRCRAAGAGRPRRRGTGPASPPSPRATARRAAGACASAPAAPGGRRAAANPRLDLAHHLDKAGVLLQPLQIFQTVAARQVQHDQRHDHLKIEPALLPGDPDMLPDRDIQPAGLDPKNRNWPVPVWRRIGHFQWDDPGSTAYRRSPHG